MNAAIDQQCEIYIKENGLEAEVEAKIQEIYKGKEHLRPNISIILHRKMEINYQKEILV
jgi:hypothetical protein